ncbi:ANKS6 [Mytilus edulis]|uniref:ANKS6 n=1 Tax=Mytilus edulis TaxID=6550 RepID=A0A8S3QCX0_MYTED|nr:ANKS6 [Mytilus edulis]
MDRVRQLLHACEHGDGHSVQALLDEGVGVDSTDDDETTPLQIAAANGHDHIVRLLLMKGAALDQPNNFGWTPLMHACRNGHNEVVVTLLQRQADISVKTRYGISAVTLAARGGHIQVVRKLVEAGIDLNNSGNGSMCEFTPLLVAVEHGHDAVLRFLLDRGCDVNNKTASTGLTPLMLAAVNGHLKTAQILIESGADANLTSINNRTALDMATAMGKSEVASYLDRKTTNKTFKESDEKKPDIIDATKKGDLRKVRSILDLDPSQLDACSPHDGATSVMFAAMTGQLEIAQLLVERGCDINKQDTISGWTALMQATYHGKKSIAMFLLDKGADVRIQANNGCTAFDMASLIDDVDTELVRKLASKTIAVPGSPEKGGKKVTAKQNGVASSLTDISMEEPPKSGLKGWLNRLSNRFRNIKIGRTLNLSNRVVSMSSEKSTSVQDLTLKSTNSPKVPVKKMNNFMEHSQSSPSIPSVNNYGNTYTGMALENKQSATVYTLDINPPSSNMSNDTLKPVIPPFLPPPSFALDTAGSTRKPVSARGPGSSSSVTSLLGGRSHTHMSASPMIHARSSSRLTNGTTSSSADYHNGLFSSESSSTPNRPTPIFVQPYTPTRQNLMPRKPPISAVFTSNTTSPNSSTSGSSSVTPIRSHGRSTSSKESTTSTLTPSPSPTPGKYPDDHHPLLGSLEEHDSQAELSGILSKLSLEKYQPIFEEQEVDMEAFLTLTDQDLKELGISNTQSRSQILTAINKLSTGKGKERQQLIDTMTSFQSTLKAKVASEPSNLNGMMWLQSHTRRLDYS